MSSKTAAIFPIVSALAQAREYGQARTEWTPDGGGAKEQERYLPWLSKLNEQVHLFSAEELKAVASANVEEINAFLKEGGFDITLDPFQNPNDFGTASIMSVLVKWKAPGEERWLSYNGEDVKAARLDDGVCFYRQDGYEHPIARISTETGDKVYMTIADGSLEGLDLLEKVNSLTDADDSTYEFDGVTFPMVLLDQEVDIEFFKGMYFVGTGAAGDSGMLRIAQAKQQTKFKMNHLGAKAESAAAFGMAFECCAMPKPEMVIDKPFYIWMTRPGMDMPYFAGYIDPADWKDPGEIK